MVVPLELHEGIIDALDQSHDIIVTIHDYATFTLQYISTNVEPLIGYFPNELIGTNIYELRNSKIHYRKNKFGGVLEMEIIFTTTLPQGNILTLERILSRDHFPSDANHAPMMIINSTANIMWSNNNMNTLLRQSPTGPVPPHLASIAHLDTGSSLLEALDQPEVFQAMIDPLLKARGELERFQLKLKLQNGTKKSVEVDSLTTYLATGEFLHTTLFFYEPLYMSPSKGAFLSPLLSPLSPAPPPCSPIDKPPDPSGPSSSRPLEISSSPSLRVSSLETQFFAQMSHDIRTPVSGIIGMASLLQMTSLTLEQKEFVDTIESSSSLLLALLNDILDLTKIEAGKIELEFIPFSLPKVLTSLSLSLLTSLSLWCAGGC
jgi:hypothetical protein